MDENHNKLLAASSQMLLLAEPLKVVDVAYRCALQAFLISEIPRVQFPAGPLSLVKKA